MLTNSEHEIELGRRARRLAADLQSLRGADLPVQTELGLNTLRPLFASLIERWKWDVVIGAEGNAFLTKQWDLWKSKERSYLSAVRSYVKAYATGKISDRPADGYFYTAKDAETEMIPASEPAVESEDELKRIHKTWIFSPYLGPEFPVRTIDELAILARGIGDMEEGIRGTALEASGSEPCVSTAAPGPPPPAQAPHADEKASALEALQVASLRHLATRCW